MKAITIEVPDEVYEACQQMAAKYGRTVEEGVPEFLVKYEPKLRSQSTGEERQAARKRLLQWGGAVNSGDPHSADNERIDADLAYEYGSPHEEEGSCSLTHQGYSAISTWMTPVAQTLWRSFRPLQCSLRTITS